MSVRLRLLTAALKKSAIRRHYPKGLAGFRRDFPNALEDTYLFGLVSMSGGELQEILARVGEKGLSLVECCAVGDQFIGPIERHPHFEFESFDDGSLKGWQVRLIDDDADVLAEDGVVLLRHFIRMGWAISLDEEEKQ